MVVVPDAYPEGTIFNFTTGQTTPDEHYDFKLMVNLWDHVSFRNPLDLNRIGELKFFMFQTYFDVEAWDQTDVEIPLTFHTCSKADVDNFPKDIHKYVSEDYYSDYLCLDDGQPI